MMSTLKLAERMNRLGTEGAFEVLAMAKEMERSGIDVVHLEIGEPDFDTPRNIVDAAVNALNRGETHYSPAQGILELREAIADYLNSRYGSSVKPSEVVVFPGGKTAIMASLMAIVDEGDEVIYPNPGYPAYESIINFLGAKPVPLPLKEERGFSFKPEDLEALITPKTKAVIINTPQNPTGGIIRKEDMEKLVELAEKHGFYIISDEIYDRILYDPEKFTSVMEFPEMRDRIILLNGFSKTYAMTGWRLGYTVSNEELAKALTKLAINIHSCVATFIQWAGVEALRGPQDAVDAMVAEFRRRRDYLLERISKIPGIRCHKPEGAFYLFINIQDLGVSSDEFAKLMLKEYGVALLSGTAFGKYGEGFIRISYATSMENLKKAMDRLERAIQERRWEK